MELKDFDNKNLIFESAWKTIGYTFFSGAFLLYSVTCIDQKVEPFWFWSSIIMWSFATLFGLFRLLNPKNLFLSSDSVLAKEYSKLSFERHYNDNGIFEFSASGFKVNVADQALQYQWLDVSTIFGYKKDRYATDTICVDVFTTDGKGFTINEETRGWFQFLKSSKENLKEIPASWEIEIATPVFETKLTLLFSKDHKTFEQATEEHYQTEKKLPPTPAIK